jgi:outer membrane protein OmpA-like peptidoglycan-associated protein/tetratricopeptide (TPR) repeat protein
MKVIPQILQYIPDTQRVLSGILLVIAVLSLSTTTWAQTPEEEARQYLELADDIMAATNALDDAREIYVTAADLDPKNVRANYKAGDAYYRTINKERAVKYFLRVYELDPNFRFNITYLIARSYQYAMDFDTAIKYYLLYLERLATDGARAADFENTKVVERRIYECENGKKFMADPLPYAIINLGANINSEYSDFGPAFNEDETEMVFTTRRRDGNTYENVANDNKPFEDIFIAKKVNGVWQKAKNIGSPVNTIYHDSNLALSADGKQLFLYKDVNNGDIYVTSRRDDGSWTVPIPIPGMVNSSYAEASISISPNGKVLFFSSNRPGGIGNNNFDIYYCTLDENGDWTRPRNLGPAVNTEYDEDGPFIDYDGKTLYFSSKGHEGMGGYDIFRTVYDSTSATWSKPENLGYPINSPDDDVYYVSTKKGKTAYYASVREDGMGYTDIYMISEIKDIPKKDPVTTRPTTPVETPIDTEPADTPTPQPTATVQPLVVNLTVLDGETGLPMDAKVSMKSADNLMVGARKTDTGKYTFEIRSESAKNYQVSVEKDGYVFVNQSISLPGSSANAAPLNREVTLRKLRVGVSGVLRNIYFDFDKATFKTESYNELNKLEKMLSENPNLMVEIGGHTDNIGTWAYNKELSLRRAQAVVNYLKSKGIDPRRLTAVGYGKERPLASNDDEKEGRELNRRVEFKVVGER